MVLYVNATILPNPERKVLVSYEYKVIPNRYLDIKLNQIRKNRLSGSQNMIGLNPISLFDENTFF